MRPIVPVLVATLALGVMSLGQTPAENRFIQAAGEALSRKDNRGAMQAYQAALASDLTKIQRANTMLNIAGLRVELGDKTQARTDYRDTISFCDDDPAVHQVLLQAYHGLAGLYSEAGDRARAVGVFKELLRDKRFRDDHTALARTHLFMGHTLWDAGEHEKAAAEYLIVIGDLPHGAGSSDIALGSIRTTVVPAFQQAGVLDAQTDAILLGLRRGLPHAHLYSPINSDRLQEAIVEVMLQAGRAADALYEAKIGADVASSPETLRAALLHLEQATKAADANISRYSLYLDYRRSGPLGPDGKRGTDDDVADPYADVSLPDPKRRDETFAQLMKNAPPGWSGHMHRSTMYRFWGRPELALDEAMKGYLASPVDPGSLQTAGAQVIAVLYQLSGNADVGKDFVEFQKWGPAGKDGKAGTEDDLTDPVAVWGNEK
jgi:tetratricopeptide (TPR) repeat protein